MPRLLGSMSLALPIRGSPGGPGIGVNSAIVSLERSLSFEEAGSEQRSLSRSSQRGELELPIYSQCHSSSCKAGPQGSFVAPSAQPPVLHDNCERPAAINFLPFHAASFTSLSTAIWRPQWTGFIPRRWCIHRGERDGDALSVLEAAAHGTGY